MTLRILIALAAAVALGNACGRNDPPARSDLVGDGGDGGPDAGDPAYECSVESQSCDAGSSCSLYLLDGGGLGSRCFDAECDLVDQDCDAGLKCTYVEDAGVSIRTCVDDGTAGEGAPCAPLISSDTCRAGTFCVPVRNLDGGVENRCLRFCHRDSDCGTADACYLTIRLAGTAERPLVCARPCDLFAQDCPPGEACYPGPNVPACYDEGETPLGADCVRSNECIRGAACIPPEKNAAPKCTALCAYPSGPPACATGTCTLLDYEGASDAGACLPR